ncbi:hypothetical protein DFH28DRAFT_1121207 [Melampsora americana]|nr:hypothetical protein DFH28DRAFT_1121207 [Melampsora americana]
MTRIKRSWKKAPETNPRVVALIKEFLDLPDHELTLALERTNLEGWQWPRSDLVFWIPVLNRFDSLLESVVKDYELRGPGSKKEKDVDGKEIKEDESTRVGVQINDFTPLTKRMTLSILGFVKLLLENCTNRKLFSSYDRLNDLLLTTDTDVLLANLRLILRSAQQWSAQHQDMNSGFGISHARLLDLLQSWSSIGGAKTSSLSLVELVQQAVQSPSNNSDNTQEMLDPSSSTVKRLTPEVSFQFYRKAEVKPPLAAIDTSMHKVATDDKGKGKDSATLPTPGASSSAPLSSHINSASNSTPTPKSRVKDRVGTTLPSPLAASSTTTEGLATINISPSTIEASDRPQDLLANLIEEYALPLDCRFKLFHRIRIAMAVRDQPQIRRMAVVRLLALAIYTHTTDETTSASKLFIYEPGLIAQLSELINLDTGDARMAGEIQAAAFYALEGISRYRGRIAEVASAAGVSVSHGILMQVVRKMAKELEKEEARCTDEFIDSLFCFLSCLQLSAYAGSLLVGAGIVPVLVELCKNAHPKYISTVSRAVTNLDGLMYGFTSAFTLFNQADGLKVFVNRIKEQADKSIAEHPVESSSPMKPSELLTGMLAHPSAGLLKAIFRSIQRLLTSAGTLESVRNLTETQLPMSIKLIIQNKAVFGYQIYSLAINMMSTLIHSEPTSLVILQEAGLPDALYDAIDGEIEPAFDVIAAIPAALGALCLNEVGLKQLNDRKAIQSIFAVFTKEKHVKILRDRDHASVVGSTIDELIRHQPSLKQAVLEATLDFLRRIDSIGRANDSTNLKSHLYELQCVSKDDGETKTHEGKSEHQEDPMSGKSDSQEVVMNEAQPLSASEGGAIPQASSASKQKEKDGEKEKDGHANNAVLLQIDVACRLLESMLQNVAHCQDFISMGALDVLLGLVRLPCIPYDFAITPASEAFASTIRVLTETLPKETLTVVMKQLRVDLIQLKPFWETIRPNAQLPEMISPSPEKIGESNTVFRHLISVQAYISFLSDICVASGYAHTRTAVGILGVLNNPEESETMSNLGALQRVVNWEHIMLKAHAPKSWSNTSTSTTLNIPTTPAPPIISIPVSSLANTAGSGSSGTNDLAPGRERTVEGIAATIVEATTSAVSKPAEAPEASSGDPSVENTKALKSIAGGLSSSLGPLFSAVIKLLTSRRSHDTTLRKQAMATAETLAKILLGHLVWPDSDDQFANFAYVTVALNIATSILTEERGSRTTLNSLILSTFQQAGGISAILSLFDRYLDQTEILTKEENRNPSQNVLLVHIYGGLKVALDLLQHLCSSTALLESPHTALLQTWKDAVAPGFDAPALLIMMRGQILAKVQRVWSAGWLQASPPNVVRAVVKILLDIIKAEGESVPDVPTGHGSSVAVGATSTTHLSSLERMTGALGGTIVGPFPGTGYPTFPFAGGRPTVVPDETRVANLVDMGFPRSVCETALARTQNNLNLATEFLLAQPVLVQRARDEEAARTAVAAATATAAAAAPSVDASASTDPPAATESSEPGNVASIELPVPLTPYDSAASPSNEHLTDELMPDTNENPAGLEARAIGDDNLLVSPADDDSDRQDVHMGEASSVTDAGELPTGSPIATPVPAPKAASTETTSPEEARISLKKTLDELRDPLRDLFLERSFVLAESYEGLAFDLKVAFKTFEKKPPSGLDVQSFDAIGTLLGDLRRLTSVEHLNPEDTTAKNPSDNLPAVSVRLRVLALLANDASFEDSLRRNMAGLLGVLMQLLSQTSLTSDPQDPTQIPVWLASALLVLEAILAYSKSKQGSDASKSSTSTDEDNEDNEEDDDDETDDNMLAPTGFLGLGALTADSTPNKQPSSIQPSTSKASKAASVSEPETRPTDAQLDLLFQICTNLLRFQQCSRHDFLAAIRVLLILTQKHTVAEAFLSSGVPAILLRSFSFKTETRGCLPYAAMLLRHTVESASVKKAVMKKEIVHFITTHHRHRQSDLSSFCRQIAPMAWRDWPTLMDTIESTCKLIPNDSSGSSWMIGLANDQDEDVEDPSKKATHSVLKIPSANDPNIGEMQVDEGIGHAPEKVEEDAPWRPAVDGTMQFLMSELLKAGKDCLVPNGTADVSSTLPTIIRPPIFSHASSVAAMIDTEAADSSPELTLPSSSNFLLPPSVSNAASKPSKAEDQQVAAFSHACFIMSWMSELLASYNECKISFMSFHNRKGKSTKTTATLNDFKSRHEILNFMLSDLIPTGPLSQPNTAESQKKSAIASWAIMVLVALCHEPNAMKEPAGGVTTARAFVINGLGRAFQDAIISDEPVDTRYGRLYALSDLAYRLLTAAPFAQRPSATPSDAPIQIAKIMLEKNFAALLSNALADVDLNFPSVQRLLNSILRPLEHLTKAVTKIGRSTTDRKAVEGSAGATSTVEVESVTSDSSDGDEEMVGDDDAPDLYRNSALGLYEGELEPGNRENTPTTSEDGEHFDDEDEDMDDIDDGALLGSDLSDASEEEGDVTADMGDADTDTSEADHDDEDDDDDEDDEDDEDEDDDGDEDEMVEDDTDLDLDMSAGAVEADIGIADNLENTNVLGDDTRLINFLNHGRPELVLPSATDDILPTVHEAGDLEDNLEDDEAASLADPAHAVVDDGFEGGSIDFGDEVVVDSNLGDAQTEATPWSWNGVLPFQPRGEFQAVPGVTLHRHSLLHQATDNVFGRQRAGQPNTSISVHPLLTEDSAAPVRGEGSGRSHRRMDLRSGSMDQWLTAIENLLGGGAGQIIEQILGTVAVGQRPIHIDLGQGPNGPSLGGVVIDPTRGVVMPVGPQGLHGMHASTSAAPASRLDRHLADRVAGQTLMPLATLPRWSEEARVFHQTASSAENPTRIQKSILAILGPRAKKIAQEKAAKFVAEAKRLQTDVKSDQDKKTATEAAVPQVQSSDDAVVASADESAVQAATPLASAADDDVEMRDGTDEVPSTTPRATEFNVSPEVADAAHAMEGVTVQDDVAEVMNLARQLAAGIGASIDGDNDASSLLTPNAPSSVETAEVSTTEPASSASQPAEVSADPVAPEPGTSTASRDRVTIMINGAEVDITDTGVDPTFLEALPDDMREEVLNQHFREQRPAREELSVPVPSSISPEFLDALPPEIRAEVIRSEVADQERRRREEQRDRRALATGSTRTAVEPAEVDPATFLASLDPSLREAVLLEQDDGFISTLPPNLLAEVDAMRDRMTRRHHAIRPSRDRDPLTGLPITSSSGLAVKKAPPKADAVQVLDRSGIAALVRLMFFPQPLRRHSLQKVLVNLCENSRSRTELIGTLLGLLQDGTRDAATIDKSFSQVSSRASKALTPATPKSTIKLRRETHVGPLPQFPGESVPNLIALRCLEALSLLVTANDRVPVYFLTEQEVPLASHRKSAKKGKGKEKVQNTLSYPIVSLLALLDQSSLLKQPNLTESITSLLALIGRPLTALAKRLEEGKLRLAPAPSSPTPGYEQTQFGRVPTAPATIAQPSASPNDGSAPSTSEKIDTPPNALEKAPALPPQDLRMIVNVLDSGECSSKTFSHTVTFIQAVSIIPNGRETIASELLERANVLGNALLPDLDELALAIREAPNAAEVRSTTLAKFSSASAQQAKLLRILKTTEFLDAHAKKQEPVQLPAPEPSSPLTMTAAITASVEPDLFSPTSVKADEQSKAQAIRFRPLWAKLSECLTLIQERDDMIHIATVLLPLMESFLVVCKHAGVNVIKASKVAGSMSPRSDDASLSASDLASSFFLSFTERHRKVLNTMVRNNPGLMSGSFSILVHNPKVLEFDNKRNYFSQQLHKARSREQYGTVQLNVRRPHVFEDSFHSLARRTGDELKYGKLSVRFYDEEGVDAGGVTREWLTILVKQMLDPNYALFTGSAADSKTYQPNRASAINPDHLGFFTFCGRVIGKALYDGRVVDAYFTLAFYKHLLGTSVGLSDLESVDPDHHRSLKWMLDNDIDGIFELTFSVEADDFGSTRIVDLKPDGRNLPVTNENKAEYVQLLVQNRLTLSIKDQIEAFKKGFDEIIPRDLVRIFSATELQLLLNGLPDINVEDWRANTELHQFQQSDSTVTWFWRAVRSFDQEERAKLLQFSTGSSRVPLEGFGALQGAQGPTKFSLVNAHTKNILPSAHTCFNQIDLPSYDSYDDLRRMLLIAINEGSEGFGFA